MDESRFVRHISVVRAALLERPEPSRERKRPSVCGIWPLPLASPGKGTKRPVLAPRRWIATAEAEVTERFGRTLVRNEVP
jgi:hypothetical protein